jgi:FKBP-type peptidyl-prolyl cis-trans isomerase FklB
LIAGIKDAMNDAQPKYDEATCMKALQKLSEARAGSIVTKNKKFLEENKKAEGVVTLPSGLQYKVLKAGTGATPTAKDTVRTHYEGKLIDGTVFDSSLKRNEPAEFPVEGVIAGWTEALQKMKVGDKWQLFIPSELAYGEAGAGGVIPPHATLIFEIELLDIPK